MFVLTTLVYPVVLALLCLGGALLVDQASDGLLPTMLFPAVGAAALIVLSQLSTYIAPLAPATPYLLVVLALAGLLLGTAAATYAYAGMAWFHLATARVSAGLRPGARAGATRGTAHLLLLHGAGRLRRAHARRRLSDSPGQEYSHLDLHNSYGLFVHNYYGSSYPSGSDTLFGGSSFLLGLPLIWTFQPFVAFMLATAAGPAWILVRRVGLRGGSAAFATLTVTLPALVYAYELIGSVKEIAALPLILCMGALVVDHRRWLWNGARGAPIRARGRRRRGGARRRVRCMGACRVGWCSRGVALVELRGGRAPLRDERSPQEPSVGEAPARADARGLLALFGVGLLGAARCGVADMGQTLRLVESRAGDRLHIQLRATCTRRCVPRSSSVCGSAVATSCCQPAQRSRSQLG